MVFLPRHKIISVTVSGAKSVAEFLLYFYLTQRQDYYAFEGIMFVGCPVVPHVRSDIVMLPRAFLIKLTGNIY